jgi:hypothetical protein
MTKVKVIHSTANIGILTVTVNIACQRRPRAASFYITCLIFWTDDGVMAKYVEMGVDTALTMYNVILRSE